MAHALKLGVVFSVALALLPAAATASFPGANGKIAFSKPSTGTINVVNADGTGETALTAGQSPAWSPDGTKIAFSNHFSVYTMNADGSGVFLLTAGEQPAWSPDGSQIVFVRSDGDSEIHRIGVDGAGATKLTDNTYPDTMPAWSPDGGKIAFESVRPSSSNPSDIWLMDPDGGNQESLTSWPFPFGPDSAPNWSPDGSRVTYWVDDFDDPTELDNGDIYVAARDGSTFQQLTEYSIDTDPAWSPDGRLIVYRSRPICCSTDDFLYTIGSAPDAGPRVPVAVGGKDPDWQPLYHVPSTASPLAVSLVPNFRQTISTTQCQSRAGQPSTHGPPLAFTSCAPPAFAAGTVAHFGPSALASAMLTAVPGDFDPANGDQADLSVSTSLTDIRTASGGDYDPSASDATLVARLRISDTYNGGSLNDPATVTEVNFAVPLDCSASVDPGEGSTCAVATTADSTSPGAIRERKNTVIQTFRVRVNDAGANGSRGDPDDRTFATQGVYIP